MGARILGRAAVLSAICRSTYNFLTLFTHNLHVFQAFVIMCEYALSWAAGD
jgi:hypothetical protein